MAWKPYAPKKKTPYGRKIDNDKPVKARVKKPYTHSVCTLPFKMAFLLMTMEDGQTMPSDEDQLEFIIKNVKEKNYLTNIQFVDVPVKSKTLVFRVEKWIASGELKVSRMAKSVTHPELKKPIYVCVKNHMTWSLN